MAGSGVCVRGEGVVRSRVQTVTPKKAAEYLQRNTANRPLAKRAVREFAQAMRRGEWLVTHQGVAFDTTGALVDGQHRLAAVIEADIPVEMTVFTEVPVGAFDVLDTGKRRNAADVLAIEGEKSAVLLAAMVRTVWLYQNRPELSWSGGDAGVSNHQIVQTLQQHPKLRDFVAVGEQVGTATGMIKSAAAAASYLVTQASSRDLTPWFDGIIEGTGLVKSDPRLLFRRVMFNHTRKPAGQPLRRRETREHVTLHLKAFNAWTTDIQLTGAQLKYTPREPVPPIHTH